MDPKKREFLLEQYLILLIGASESPVPTNLHLHKEFFVVCNTAPKLSEIIRFEKHMYGPYSPDINEAIKNPVFYPDAFEYRIRELPLVGKMIADIALAADGKKIFDEIVAEYSGNSSFRSFMSIAKAVRILYDPLTVQELLLLIYSTFGDWAERSIVYDQVMSAEFRKKVAEELLKKGIITEERYRELVEATV